MQPIHDAVAVASDDPAQQESNHWSRTLIAIAIATVVIATISFILRLYSRRKTAWKLAIEDFFMAIGLVCSYGLSTCVIIGMQSLLVPCRLNFVPILTL